MPLKQYAFQSLFILLAGLGHAAHAQISTIDQYNQTLPMWGTSWTPSARSINGYNASFYTGFAPRSQNPNRIHVHMARGNQTRVTVILDDQTIRDYLYDLSKRADFYRQATRSGWINLAPPQSSFTPHAQAFENIVASPTYGIQDFVRGSHTPEETYLKSIRVMSALNRMRIFHLNINLSQSFLKWKKEILDKNSDKLEDPKVAAFVINTMLLGRVNYLERPTSELTSQLVALSQTQDSDGFVRKALELFKIATQDKYNFRVLNADGQFVSPISCESAQSCFLKYSEFTAIYPTGSVKNTVQDSEGNSIPDLALPGLWNFQADPGADVDNIHPEPYYGFIPKLDYEDKGFNFGFHNPAVRFYQVDPTIKNVLSIPLDHTTYWSVKRGGVSHGCSRLAAGHTWELRHILPVENEKMVRVHLFANLAQEFDVFDVNGDGEPEVMGVDYLLSYDLQDASNGLSREGAALQVGLDHKTQFYQSLYGAKNVFRFEDRGRSHFTFVRPTIAVHTFVDLNDRFVNSRYYSTVDLPLYEQAYEKDKIQFYDPVDTNLLDGFSQAPISKRLVRLLGRVRGCAPQSDKNACGEAAFESEALRISKELGRPL